MQKVCTHQFLVIPPVVGAVPHDGRMKRIGQWVVWPQGLQPGFYFSARRPCFFLLPDPQVSLYHAQDVQPIRLQWLRRELVQQVCEGATRLNMVRWLTFIFRLISVHTFILFIGVLTAPSFQRSVSTNPASTVANDWMRSGPRWLYIISEQ